MDQQLEQTQKISMRLSQQQLRLVRMLEYTAPELDEVVERELEDNPALDIKEEREEEVVASYPAWFPRTASHSADDHQFSPPDESENLYDQLLIQLSDHKMSAMAETAARFIIGSLDSNGYLDRSIDEIIDDLMFGQGIEVSRHDAETALEAVRSLDPPGIGARNLQDCLRMQLERLQPSQKRDDALRIINEAYEAFTMKHRHRIITSLKMTDQRASEALDLILSLNPKPGSALGNSPSDSSNVIVPDFIVNNEDGKLTITLNNRIPELRIDESFEQAVSNMQRTARGRVKKGSEFIVTRYNDARDFIKILAQRQQTMMAVMTAIVKIQEEYFLTEDVYKLKPMIIKNVADMTGLDISAISRVTSNKYVSLPWGVFPLRFFFSDTIGEEKEGSESVTNRKIEARIAALIEKEDKKRPLSDRRIMEQMNAEGFDLSRRTVAKYRDRQGIPVARLRKEM